MTDIGKGKHGKGRIFVINFDWIVGRFVCGWLFFGVWARRKFLGNL